MQLLSVRSDDSDLFIFHHPNPNELNGQLEKDILLCGDKQDRSTNVKALMTDWNMFDYSESFTIICNWIHECFTQCPLVAFVRHKEYKMTSLWGNYYVEGDETISHIHSPSFYSFVYFVKGNYKSAPLVFDASSTYIRPEQGKLIFFPSHLLHHVPKQRNNCVRVTISGNILTAE